MSEAPTPVAPANLDELYIQVKPEAPTNES